MDGWDDGARWWLACAWILKAGKDGLADRLPESGSVVGLILQVIVMFLHISLCPM